jgi:hypothetical protein
VSLGKVMVLVIGLFVLTGPAAAWSTSYSWSGPGYQSPFSSPGGFYSPYGSLDSPLGYGYSPYSSLGSMMGYSPYSSYGNLMGYSPYSGYGNTLGYSPYSSYGNYPSGYSQPKTTSNLLDNGDLLSNFGDTLGGSVFNTKKDYGTPPTANITKALVGQNLSRNSGFMGIPLEYTLDKTDIGDITGTQYKGADAWKVRVGQADIYWDVIMDETGNNILNVSQA